MNIDVACNVHVPNSSLEMCLATLECTGDAHSYAARRCDKNVVLWEDTSFANMLCGSTERMNIFTAATISLSTPWEMYKKSSSNDEALHNSESGNLRKYASVRGTYCFLIQTSLSMIRALKDF